jgi:glutamate-1-semialdehyde 2,1-aminomutase
MRRPTDVPTPLDTTRSRRLHDEALRVLPGGTSRSVHQTQPHPIYAREGAGSVVTDVDGNRYVDFYNNATSLIHGHAHPAIVAAIDEQARRGTAFSLPVEQQIGLAEMICARIPSAEQARFANSGSEAILLALKAARAIAGRSKIAKFEGLYHGSADAVEVSLEPDPETWGRGDSPAAVAYTPQPPPGLLDSVIVLPFNDVQAVESILPAHASELAAVLIDVLPMRLGFTAARPEWLAALRRVTREHGILLISDEVVAFRLDHGGAQALHGFEADLTVLGKIIGGGLPIGAVAGPRDVMRAFDGSGSRPAVPNAGTFNANPMTLAAGIAALTALPAGEIERINGLGDSLRARAQSAFEEHGLAAHTTGIGSLFGVHMTDRRFTDYRGFWAACVADPGAKRRQRALYDGLRERGVLLTVGGVGAISTAMTDEDVETFLAALVDAVTAMELAGLWSEGASG